MHRLLQLSFGLSAVVVFGVALYFKAPVVEPVINYLQPPISTLIIPHHDAVKDIRQDFLAETAKKISQPKTIILLSPNHYQSGRGELQTSSQVWQLTNGSIVPNEVVINRLTGLATEEPESFTNEHGIKAVLANVWQVFPRAMIVPVIFKENVARPKLDQLVKVLTESCDDCLLVSSVDFSHYQPPILANLHDQLTKRAMLSLDADKILADAEVDSPPALAATILWAETQNTQRLVLARQTNTSIIGNSPDLEGTSHFFGYYTRGAKTQPEPAVSFIIGGDMMFGRMIAHTFLADGLEKSLAKLGDRVFWGTDASIINLEGPVSKTPVPDDIRTDNLTFNFPPQTIKALRSIKVKAASLANNHSANAGSTGLSDTRELLKGAEIMAIGGPGDSGLAEVASFKGEGLTLDVIGVHTLITQPDLSKLIKELKAEPTHRVLVFPHWGVEYQPTHSARQEELAHQWIDAGADMVIGAHPHVIQDAEVYKNRPIFYSLGNLLFDQTFSQETQQGLLIAGEVTENETRLFALPVGSIKYQPQLIRGERKTKILDTLYQPLTSYLQHSPAGDTVVIHYK